ncbi:MAG: isomerase, partial [Verrucomicrobiaceae bacterium]|nr:isomerase [Verrucomicrobiaceae bacterium]
MTITDTRARTCGVRGVRLYEMREVEDHRRGSLTVGEFGHDLPFIPRRYFITHDIPTAQTRGEH